MSFSSEAFASDVPVDDPSGLSFVANNEWRYRIGEPMLMGPNQSVEVGNSGITWYYSVGYGYLDIVMYRPYKLANNDVIYTFDNEYKGYLRVRDRIEADVWCSSLSKTPCTDVQYLGVEVKASDYFISDRTTASSISNGNAGSTYFNNTSIHWQARIDTSIYFIDQPFSVSNLITFEYKFRVFFHNDTFSTGSYPTLNFMNSLNVISGYDIIDSVIVSAKSDKYYLYNIFQSLGVLDFDNSGTADNVNQAAFDANIAESAADQVISSALPSADNEIDDILNYDYTSIGTDSLTALSFWKSLGDYILSNSNLVGIGALLIACLFLGFVIYLLRL